MVDNNKEAKLKAFYFTLGYLFAGLLAQWIIFSKASVESDILYIIAGCVVLLALPSFLINFCILYFGAENSAILIAITHLVLFYIIWRLAFNYFRKNIDQSI